MLNQKLDSEMLEFRNESMIVDQTQEADEWVKVMEQIEQLEKSEEEVSKMQDEANEVENYKRP